jgi:uncharacterized metal-binding protein
MLTTDSPRARLTHRRWRLLALIWTPFISIFVFAAAFWGGDTYSHVVFHVLAIGLLGGALIELRRHRSLIAAGLVGRALTGILAVSLPLAILGHTAELVTAVARLADEDWANVDTDDLFETGMHATAANVTVPTMMISMLSVLILTTLPSTRSGRRDESREDGRPNVREI